MDKQHEIAGGEMCGVLRVQGLKFSDPSVGPHEYSRSEPASTRNTCVEWSLGEA
jgi:hypothetical protein